MNSVHEQGVIVIGRGFGAIYQTYKLREPRSNNVIMQKAASSVGGAWHWNRYPDARLDSGCYTNAYHLAQELIHDWVWTKELPTQPQLSTSGSNIPGKKRAYTLYAGSRTELRRTLVEVAASDYWGSVPGSRPGTDEIEPAGFRSGASSGERPCR